MTTIDPKTKYALYCRKSTEDSSRQVLSLDSQEQEMTRLAKTMGLVIVKVFRESKSAKKPDNRPQFSELVKLIKRGQIDGIICWKIDRISRNPIDSAIIQWLLQQNQLKIIQTMDRQYLPSDNALLYNVESGMANQYIIDLSKNVKRGIRAKLERGQWPHLAPLGYLNKDSRVVVDLERAKYIRKMFELYNTGQYSVKAISDQLYTEGLRSRSGRKYYKSKIHKILNDPFYCGIMEHDGQKYLGKHEQIISKKLFDNVQEVITGKAHTKRQVIPFAFRGILRCANCGCQLTATQKKGKHTYYYCTNGKGNCAEHKAYINETDLSKELQGIFDELIFDDKCIELVYKAKLEEKDQTNLYLKESISNLKNRLRVVNERKNALLDAYLDKTISLTDYEAKKTLLDNESVGLEIDLRELEVKNNGQDQNTLERIKEVFLGAKNMKKKFLLLKPSQQRDTLTTLLWNANLKNKKIANTSFKQPYDVLSKIENKSDFLQVRRRRDSNP